MPAYLRIVLLSAVLAVHVGCAQSQQARAPQPQATVSDQVQSTSTTSSSDQVPAAERKIRRTARMRVEAENLGRSANRVRSIVRGTDGFVERSNVEPDRVLMSVRVPSAQLDAVMDSVGQLGKVKRQSTSAEDVTDQYADLEARLESKRALRDRLRALLDRANSVQNVLSVERELSRVQADVESMEARLERLQSQVALSTLDVELKEARVLGPVGYVFKGLWWGVKKLFVIR